MLIKLVDNKIWWEVVKMLLVLVSSTKWDKKLCMKTLLKNDTRILFIFHLWLFWPKMSRHFQTRMFRYLNTKMRKQYIMRISRHFGTENYSWRLYVVQNLCEFFQFFLYGFLNQNVPIYPNCKLLQPPI